MQRVMNEAMEKKQEPNYSEGMEGRKEGEREELV